MNDKMLFRLAAITVSGVFSLGLVARTWQYLENFGLLLMVGVFVVVGGYAWHKWHKGGLERRKLAAEALAAEADAKARMMEARQIGLEPQFAQAEIQQQVYAALAIIAAGGTFKRSADGSFEVAALLPVARPQTAISEVAPQATLISAPKRMYSLIDLMHSQGIDGGQSIIGYKADGQPIQGRLFDIEDNLYNSIFTVGDQGYGKSSFAVLIAAYTVLRGGRLLVIDPESDLKQSLTTRLGPLVHEAFMLCEVADTPEKVERLLDIAEAEIEHPGDYPVLFLVDELSMIARHAEVGMGKWKDVGKRILSVCEDYATRGRKRIRRAIVMGQFTQGKRNGGTTLRYAMATMCFRLDEKQSKWALDLEDAKQTPYLGRGEVMIIPSKSTEPKARMQVIYPDDIALAEIATEALGQFVDADFSEFQGLETESFNGCLKLPRNVLEISPETALKAKSRRVREMRSQGQTQRQIIGALWGITPGGSAEYAKARDEYLSIIRQITLEDTEEA
ncbi:MAG: hypothetical protein AUF65_01675 [Chloroflexi bacterium 13_1_20CM_50_12]|nr:MAG: hypothetical protein AUF65_01675 [Chloroflexi bacterium 13_1_20CM_50_12]